MGIRVVVFEVSDTVPFHEIDAVLARDKDLPLSKGSQRRDVGAYSGQGSAIGGPTFPVLWDGAFSGTCFEVERG